MRRLALLPLCWVLWGCPPAVNTEEGAIIVGPKGGTFAPKDGCAGLEIPEGALETEATLSMQAVAPEAGIPPADGRTLISVGCRITPSSLTFKKSIRVHLHYQQELVPAGGVDPRDFDVRRQQGTLPPEPLAGLASDTTLSTVSGQTSGLGLFWATSPNDPVVGDFTVTPLEAQLRVGDTVQLTPRVTGLQGQELPDVEVTYRVVPERVGEVDASGLFTALAPGNAVIQVAASTLVREVAVYVQGDAQGPLLFVHDTPFPTGNDLLGGSFGPAGSLLLAGSNGTVLGHAEGQGWHLLNSTPGVRFSGVAASADGQLVAVGTVGTDGVLSTRKVGEQTWTHKTFTSAAPRVLWFDGTHGMAVGSGNDVLVLHEGSWGLEDGPSFETLLALAGDGQGGFVTVGSLGSLFVYDPATRIWDALYDRQLSVLLTAAVLVDAGGQEAWAVGGNRLWHFQNAEWRSISLPASPELEELTAVAVLEGRVLVAGSSGTQGWLLTYDPAVEGTEEAWTSQSLRGPQVARALFVEGARAYAVGDYGALWRYEPEGFVEESRGFYDDVVDVSVAPDGTVVAALNACVDDACSALRGRVVRREGPSDWRPLMAEGEELAGGVFSVLARGANDIFLGTATGVRHFDGSVWTEATPLRNSPFRDLTLCGDEVWAVGGGWVLSGQSTLTSVAQDEGGNEVPFQADITAVHCSSPTDVWLAGEGLLAERTAQGWVTRDSQDVPHAGWRAVYSPAPGEAFAFGAASYGVYWDTEQLRPLQAFPVWPDLLGRMWGSSIDNLYLVGSSAVPFQRGVALRFDGADWWPVDSGASRTTTAVDGRSATDVWMGSLGGGLMRGVMP